LRRKIFKVGLLIAVMPSDNQQSALDCTAGRDFSKSLGLSFFRATEYGIKMAAMAGGIAALNAMSGWPREYLSLGLVVK
jgi:hypothetical protein